MDELLTYLSKFQIIMMIFYIGMKCILKEDPSRIPAIIEYMKNNLDARTDDILEYATD